MNKFEQGIVDNDPQGASREISDKDWQSNIADALDFLEASATIKGNIFNVPEIVLHNAQVAKFAELIRPYVFDAPSAPAPDAMRKATIRECINVKVFLLNIGGRSEDWIIGFDAGTNAFIDALEKLALSEPMPPPDGAVSEADHLTSVIAALKLTEDQDIEFFLKQPGWINDPRGFVRSFRNQIINAAAGEMYERLSSSPGAAEPDDKINSVADSTGEKTGMHGASKDAGGHGRDGITSASTLSAEPDDVPNYETAAWALGFRMRPQDGKWWHPSQQHFVKSHDTAAGIFDWYFGKGWAEKPSATPDDVRSALEQILKHATAPKRMPSERLDSIEALAKSGLAALRSASVSTAPPVRDREALKRIAEFCSGDDSTLGAVARLAEVRRIADAALLSLCVQSSAAVGVTREGLIRLQEIVDLDSCGRYGRLAREAINILTQDANEIHNSDGGVGSQTRKEPSADAQSLMAAGNVDSLGVAPGPSEISPALDATVSEAQSLLDPVVDSRNGQEEATVSEIDDQDPPMKWLIVALRQLARDLLADPKTPWIGERDPKQHICWTAADRLSATVSARDAVIEECKEKISNLRIAEAGLFDAKHSGQRGQDRSDALYDAYQSLRSLAQGAKP